MNLKNINETYKDMFKDSDNRALMLSTGKLMLNGKFTIEELNNVISELVAKIDKPKLTIASRIPNAS